MNAEDQVRPFMPVYCDRDELLRCKHGFPVELAPCPKCEPPAREQCGNIIGYVTGEIFPATALGGQVVAVEFAAITGWPCPGCGADNNHFEFCRNCHRPQP